MSFNDDGATQINGTFPSAPSVQCTFLKRAAAHLLQRRDKGLKLVHVVIHEEQAAECEVEDGAVTGGAKLVEKGEVLSLNGWEQRTGGR